MKPDHFRIVFSGDSYFEFLGESLWNIFTFKGFTNAAYNAAKRAGCNRIVVYRDLE